MKRKMVGIFVCMLLIIAAVLPVAGNINNYQIINFKKMNTGIVQPPMEEWNKTYGGTNEDWGYSASQTSDGGYIITGYTDSYGAGNWDVWLIKTDAMGDELWNRTFGSDSDDEGFSVLQTSDDGYIISGETDKGEGNYDVWLIKTDASGNELWNRTFGGSYSDHGYTVLQTSDNGYIIIGETRSYGAGNWDIWLIKTDASGNELWNRTFGGPVNERGFTISQTSDGGFILTGLIEYFVRNVKDILLIKTDSSGNEQWNKTFGGIMDDEVGYKAIQTTDGGYIILGSCECGSGGKDIWLIKTDASGNEVWNKTFGGTYTDLPGYTLLQTSEGGYMIIGTTFSYGAGSYDIWLLETDTSGNELWNKTFGGPNLEWGNSISYTTDGGIIIAGVTESYGAGSKDVWIIKLESKIIPPPMPILQVEYETTKVGSLYVSGFFGINVLVKNIGNGTAKNLKWNLNIKGAPLFKEQRLRGAVDEDLEPNSTITIKMGRLLNNSIYGLGSSDITFICNYTINNPTSREEYEGGVKQDGVDQCLLLAHTFPPDENPETKWRTLKEKEYTYTYNESGIESVEFLLEEPQPEKLHKIRVISQSDSVRYTGMCKLIEGKGQVVEYWFTKNDVMYNGAKWQVEIKPTSL
jgi:hypothetical protein